MSTRTQITFAHFDVVVTTLLLAKEARTLLFELGRRLQIREREACEMYVYMFYDTSDFHTRKCFQRVIDSDVRNVAEKAGAFA